MILKVTCPSCQKAYRLSSPYPPEGKRYRCSCSAVITVSYPPEINTLVAEGKVEGGNDVMDDLPGNEPARSPLMDTDAQVDNLLWTETVEYPEDLIRTQTEPSSPELVTTQPMSPAVNLSQQGSTKGGSPRKTPPAAPTAKAKTNLASKKASPKRAATASAALPPGGPVGLKSEGGDPPAPKKKGTSLWLKLLIALLFVGLMGVGAVGGVVWHFSQDLPTLEALTNYEPPEVSRIYADDGTVIGELYEEYREVVPYDEIPETLINAFLAAEDSSYFEHGGIDYIGIARAFIVNVQEGRMAQGASTITQQVARSFLLTREKKLERKIREVLLAYQVEANFSKEHILYLYLNQIFLGEGAHGVSAAARIYFDKNVRDLTLAECAIIAGLPQAPTAYNPVRNWTSAEDRQHYVLRQMTRNKMITEEEAEAARNQPINLIGRVNRNHGPHAFFTEHVRRYLVEQYGHDAAYRGGLKVYTTLDYALQVAGTDAVRRGTHRTDRRIGFRGPLKNLSETERTLFLADQAEALRLAQWKKLAGGEDLNGSAPLIAPPLEVNERVQAVITELTKTSAIVRIDSNRTGFLAMSDHTWVYKPNAKRNWKRREQDDMKDLLTVGDVVEIEVLAKPGSVSTKGVPRSLTKRDDFSKLYRLRISQTPEVEAALFSYRTTDGAVLAMVGGKSFQESEFNRVVQAQRQAGSTFKPFVYAAAIDHPEKNYTPSTVLLDAPLTMHKESSDAENIELWKPSNYGGDYMGEITFRKALILSRNTPTVRILQDIGVPYFYEYVKKLGFDSPLNKDLSMGLGSSSVTLFELARAYSIFATGGQRVEPRFVNKVLDRDENILEEHKDTTRTDSLSPETSFVVSSLMRDVVAMGSGTRARIPGKTVAGKTGTTNDFRDAWFIGFSPDVVTGVWQGYDQPKTMGYGQAGGEASAPIWADYMTEALKTHPNSVFEKPENVVYVTVDSVSGLLAGASTTRQMKVAFVDGTEPTKQAKAEGEVDTENFFMFDAPF